MAATPLGPAPRCAHCGARLVPAAVGQRVPLLNFFYDLLKLDFMNWGMELKGAASRGRSGSSRTGLPYLFVVLGIGPWSF